MLISAGGMLPWCDVSTTAGWLNIWPDEIYGSTETGILAWRHRQQDNVPGCRSPALSSIRKMTPVASRRH
jgi:acyl-coenzyme A synthetase/AMP-(fatty) acid ligase